MWSIVLDGPLRLKPCRAGIKPLLKLNLRTKMNKYLKNIRIAVIMVNRLKLLLMAITNTLHHSIKHRGRLNITMPLKQTN